MPSEDKIPFGDKYDARGFFVGLFLFLAIGIGIGVFGHAGIKAWLIGLAIGCGFMNVTSHLLRGNAGVPREIIWTRAWRAWRRKSRD
jgi:hypothetical protein